MVCLIHSYLPMIACTFMFSRFFIARVYVQDKVTRWAWQHRGREVASTPMALKIYFAGSIRAGRADASLYQRIVKILQKYGTVLTEHVGDPALTEAGTCRPLHPIHVQ